MDDFRSQGEAIAGEARSDRSHRHRDRGLRPSARVAPAAPGPEGPCRAGETRFRIRPAMPHGRPGTASGVPAALGSRPPAFPTATSRPCRGAPPWSLSGRAGQPTRSRKAAVGLEKALDRGIRVCIMRRLARGRAAPGIALLQPGQVICVGVCAGRELQTETIRRDALAFSESFRRVET